MAAVEGGGRAGSGEVCWPPQGHRGRTSGECVLAATARWSHLHPLRCFGPPASPISTLPSARPQTKPSRLVVVLPQKPSGHCGVTQPAPTNVAGFGASRRGALALVAFRSHPRAPPRGRQIMRSRAYALHGRLLLDCLTAVPLAGVHARGGVLEASIFIESQL